MKNIALFSFIRRAGVAPLLSKERTVVVQSSIPRYYSAQSSFDVSRTSNIFCLKREKLWNCSSKRYSSTHEQQDSSKDSMEEKQSVEQDIGGGSWQEIYEGLLSTQVKLVKSFSLGTSIIGLSLQPVIINYLGSSMSLVVSFSALIGMFTFVTPALIHWFTRKYVFRLRYDPSTDLYAATTLTFFLREKTIHFRPSDVTIPEIPRMFTTFEVKNKALFVDLETFKDIEHYGRIMGYDKPVDLRVDSSDEQKKNV
uniref:Transmembrane protein 70 homolog n=1 Tax=Hirondellea gigas TaxID=1518452 RepID=A0A6A7FSZ2_9CRUS